MRNVALESGAEPEERPTEAYAEDWLLADAWIDWQCREDEAHAFVRPDGLPLICFRCGAPVAADTAVRG